MKMKSLAIFVLTIFVFLSIGCQSAPIEPLDVIIVGNEMAENQDSAAMEVILQNPTWEYLEIIVFCDRWGVYWDEEGCKQFERTLNCDINRSFLEGECFPGPGIVYPNISAILDDIGNQGWEMVDSYHVDLFDLYSFKRPKQ